MHPTGPQMRSRLPVRACFGDDPGSAITIAFVIGGRSMLACASATQEASGSVDARNIEKSRRTIRRKTRLCEGDEVVTVVRVELSVVELADGPSPSYRARRATAAVPPPTSPHTPCSAARCPSRSAG